MSEFREAVESGDRVKSLERMRDLLASRLEVAADERVIAPIAKQLADVMRELSALNPPKEESTVDELAKQRAARREQAAVPDGTAVGEQRGRRGRRPSGGGEPTT